MRLTKEEERMNRVKGKHQPSSSSISRDTSVSHNNRRWMVNSYRTHKSTSSCELPQRASKIDSNQQQKIDEDVNYLKTNLHLVKSTLNPHDDLFNQLMDITRSNPCCKFVDQVFLETQSFDGLSVGYFSTKKLAIDLSVMVYDINEYLLMKKSDLFYNYSNQYLSNSISYMKACKKHKSNELKKHLQSILNHNEGEMTRSILDQSHHKVVTGLTKLPNVSIPSLVEQSDADHI